MKHTPALFTWDIDCLNASRNALADPDSPLQPAYRQLMSRAESLLHSPLETVTAKTRLPASGNPHDYYSIGTYWWPDESREAGLPWVRRDGQTNPQTQDDSTDTRRLERLCEGAATLSLAWFFTQDARYAELLAAQIRYWFLDVDTRMNPHLNFGQAIPGVVDGRGTGLIDTRLLWQVIDAIGLVGCAEVLTPQEISEIKQWFKTFNHWMYHSDVGHAEYVWHNNHGTWYDVQRVVNALFTGELALAEKVLRQSVTQRLAAQIARDGKQHMELERTLPFHYSLFNLEAHLLLCRYAESLGDDRWQRVQDGRSLQPAIDYLLPFIRHPERWPYDDLRGIEYDSALRVLLQARRGYKQDQDKYQQVIDALPVESIYFVDRLCWHN